MGYALFAQKKLVLCGLINSIQQQQAQRSDEQLKLSTSTLSLQSKVTTLQQNQADGLANLYRKLAKSYSDEDYKKIKEAKADTSISNEEFEDEYGFSKDEFEANVFSRTSVNDQISIKQKEFEAEIDQINAQITLTSLKENALEMEVKRLDTKLTALQQQLEKIEDAEGKGIEGSTPQFSGIG